MPTIWRSAVSSHPASNRAPCAPRWICCDKRARRWSLPLVAIGGITADNAGAGDRGRGRRGRGDHRSVLGTRYARGGTGHRAAVRSRCASRKPEPHAMKTKNETLFELSQQVIPGGVNSPVRAFRSVGGTPVFFERAEGAHFWDADGKCYIDYVGFLGSARARACSSRGGRSSAAGGREGIELRRTHRGRVRARSATQAAASLDRSGAAGEFGHRSDHDGHPPGAWLYRAQQDRQVRGLLPWPCRRAAGKGRLGCAHPR